MPKKYIAIVAISTMLNGVRTIIQPGQEVSGLHPVDVDYLTKVGALSDVSAKEFEAAADEEAERNAQADYQAARAANQAAAESLTAGTVPAADPAAATPPAATPPASSPKTKSTKKE